MTVHQKNLIALIRAALTSDHPVLTEPDFSVLAALAQIHGVSAMLYPAYKKLPEPPPAAYMKLAKENCYGAASRYQLQSRELYQLLQAFRQEQLFVLPLKGVVIREVYPSPELRMMSDCDLLISPETAPKVKELMEQQGYRAFRYDLDDTDFYISPLRQNFELHKDIRKEGIHRATSEFLRKISSYAKPDDQFVYRLPDEVHYVYVVAHFAKHFIDGTVGLRPVIDLWLCRKYWTMDRERLERLLEEAGMLTFCRCAEALADYWFEDQVPDDKTLSMAEYVLTGSFLGNEDRWMRTKLLLDSQKKTKSGYYFSRLFPSYQSMCSYFPVLKKCPVLLPFYWILRFFRGAFKGRERLKKEAQILSEYDSDVMDQDLLFYQAFGLDLKEKAKNS